MEFERWNMESEIWNLKDGIKQEMSHLVSNGPV
jgi:hypothetical protein